MLTIWVGSFGGRSSTWPARLGAVSPPSGLPRAAEASMRALRARIFCCPLVSNHTGSFEAPVWQASAGARSEAQRARVVGRPLCGPRSAHSVSSRRPFPSSFAPLSSPSGSWECERVAASVTAGGHGGASGMLRACHSVQSGHTGIDGHLDSLPGPGARASCSARTPGVRVLPVARSRAACALSVRSVVPGCLGRGCRRAIRPGCGLTGCGLDLPRLGSPRSGALALCTRRTVNRAALGRARREMARGAHPARADASVAARRAVTSNQLPLTTVQFLA